MIKLYIQEQDHPWVSWDKDFYKALKAYHNDEALKDPDVMNTEIVTNKNDANLVIANIKTLSCPKDIVMNTMLYIPEYDEKYEPFIEELKKVDGCILVDNRISLCRYTDHSCPAVMWIKPTRVSMRDILDIEDVDRVGFVTVLDVAHEKSNIRDLTSAMMSAHEEITDDLKIFSGSEPQFEPFNNIRFEGLQTNKTVKNAITQAKAFVYPSTSEQFPTGLIEATLLGTPIIAKRTNITVELFGRDSEFLYETQEELEALLVKANSGELGVAKMNSRYSDVGRCTFLNSSVSLVNAIFKFKRSKHGQ
jgi:hypothetical protein